LTVAAINGIDATRAALEQYLRETAGRSAEIKADLALSGKRKCVESRCELHPAARNIGMDPPVADGHSAAQQLRRLAYDLSIGMNQPGGNRSLGLGAAARIAMVNQK
jgi:hypothetical protein